MEEAGRQERQPGAGHRLRLALGSLAALTVLLAAGAVAWRAAAPPEAVLVGAGDIAECDSEGDEATAALLDDIDGTVFTTGDNAYPDGSAEDFTQCYGPSWGRHRERTRPALGNHEYYTDGASAYFDYFGRAAGEPGRGWYSYDLAGWHVVVLNSLCWEVGGCEPDSPQQRWLRADLAASDARCTVAVWHHPRFSSGDYGDDDTYRPIWEALYDHGVELVLNGHEHFYERLAPLTPAGRRDDGRGIRQITVGTGGGELRDAGRPRPHSQRRISGEYGVLRLRLSPDRYAWRFVPTDDDAPTDTGSSACH
ncbi:MAG: metallophosphoesterase [Actinomycetota bacterium]|nr:metallophosphoesterase [Actinomycetota bacterium]